MKNRCILLLLFLLPIISNAQSKEFRSSPNTKNNGLTQTEINSQKIIKIHNDSINHQVSLVSSHLNSIQIKWDWILKNPKEKAIAEEQGWFEDMTEVRAKLEAKKQKLINSLK